MTHFGYGRTVRERGEVFFPSRLCEAGFEREANRKGHRRREDGYVDAILMAYEVD